MPGEIVAGSYTFSDVQRNCEFGSLAARGRVVTQQPPSGSAGFTMTFFGEGDSIAGTASASVERLEAGQEATVQFVGGDECAPAERVEIQLDYES